MFRRFLYVKKDEAGDPKLRVFICCNKTHTHTGRETREKKKFVARSVHLHLVLGAVLGLLPFEGIQRPFGAPGVLASAVPPPGIVRSFRVQPPSGFSVLVQSRMQKRRDRRIGTIRQRGEGKGREQRARDQRYQIKPTFGNGEITLCWPQRMQHARAIRNRNHASADTCGSREREDSERQKT